MNCIMPHKRLGNKAGIQQTKNAVSTMAANDKNESPLVVLTQSKQANSMIRENNLLSKTLLFSYHKSLVILRISYGHSLSINDKIQDDSFVPITI